MLRSALLATAQVIIVLKQPAKSNNIDRKGIKDYIEPRIKMWVACLLDIRHLIFSYGNFGTLELLNT